MLKWPLLTVALLLLAGSLLLWGRVTKATTADANSPASQAATNPTGGDVQNVKTETADFAAGCFWGSEATFRKVPGVVRTQVGYEGGTTLNPTYRQVCSHDTGHAEAVQVEFDPAKISYQKLLEIFFENHDPTTKDRQGPDVGTNYRSAIFYHSPEQKQLAEAEKEHRNKSGEYVGPIVTEIVPAATFYRAEEYHQEYFEKQHVDYACHLGNGKKR